MSATTIFAAELAHLEAELDVPYPERADLLAEIAADLDAAWTAARRRGLSDDAARADALRALALDGATRGALAEVHRSPVGRVLALLPPRARRAAEWAAAVAPVFVLGLYLFLEVPMLGIIHDGGFGMYPVLLFGAIAIISAVRRTFLWQIARNHSPEALALEGSTPLHLALLTALAGFLGTGTGIYKVLSAAEEAKITPQEMLIGFRESLGVVLTALVLATLTVLIDVTARALLRRSGVPRP